MKIEILQTFKDGALVYTADDKITVSDDDGVRFCANGWARDMAGDTATGTPDTSPKTLVVKSIKHSHAGKTIGA
jgi:hypothetical protein